MKFAFDYDKARHVLDAHAEAEDPEDAAEFWDGGIPLMHDRAGEGLDEAVEILTSGGAITSDVPMTLRCYPVPDGCGGESDTLIVVALNADPAGPAVGWRLCFPYSLEYKHLVEDEGDSGRDNVIDSVLNVVAYANDILRHYQEDNQVIPLSDEPDTLVVCVRDPDASNEFAVYGLPVKIHDVDLGYLDLNATDEYLMWAGTQLLFANDFEERFPDAAANIRAIVTAQCPYAEEPEWEDVLARATKEGHV